MQVVVGEQGTGKTDALIKWLLEGRAIPDYPGWSRAIVTNTSKDAALLINRVRTATCYWPDVRAAYDVRKAVWTRRELRSMVGLHGVEYALENLDLLITTILGVSQMPTVVSITADQVKALVLREGTVESIDQKLERP